MARPEVTPDSAEQRRRRLLAESDAVLERVEQLRLQDHTVAPERLREAIRGLQARLGRPDPPPAPSTLQAAHELVLAVQQRLLASNPRNLLPRAHPGRASGQPVMAHVRGGGRWKLLTLPPPPASGADRDWLALVESTVERACDRWAYAQHQAIRAAREKVGVDSALARARAAWRNYWELRLEADRLRLSLGAAPGPTGRPR